ncbi:rho GTPase-activating protein 30-like isoform X2 [Hoplias malabaricus]|uniref:rho GTPase-activating protein 30-like isoform X2 n=1 Tax=Hoplias malabaricus TaxID=27720 RepID=UPI003462FDD7
MKRGRRKGGSKDKVFGCDLLEHLNATNQEIPQVLRSCSEFIEEHGIVDGIYRLSGVSSNTQKLRSEFDNEGNPELYKDVYLQDIHCVSSLCKAYFRELPNPLLTYQLYDRFAEAVAVQLEDERLVKIKEVLKELPGPHYRTLEYLMRHLVKMSRFSDETNMHARNLAIVWAPNLLRSKDIEASGFNGTAAFMEVRVQSIVVEFILTHVAQLFPDSDTEPGMALERRKSLPSPSALSSHDDQFFKALPFQFPGNMSPGDGPPAMRPYHAIIDGTDKRKGSLKGRKWMSIFNLGGRLQDPRKKQKYPTKEKEKQSLRPAKSMDSLSSGPSATEDSRHSSTHLAPLVTPSGTSESATPGSGGIGSGYAVTYRRTGGASVSMVGGGSGTQGTYKSLEPGGPVSGDRSPASLHGVTTKAERRAGMHISGPFSVTVPLHITSGLALGVLQGGRNEEDLSQQGVTEEEQPKKLNTAEQEQPVEGGKNQEGGNQVDDTKDVVEVDSVQSSTSEVEEKKEVKTELEEVGPEEKEGSQKEKIDHPNEKEESSKAQHAADRPSLSEDTVEDMKPGVALAPVAALDEGVMSYNPKCEEEEYLQQDLPLDFQDTFGFLDLMDTSASSQINEFSVEPPGFEEQEDEEEDFPQNQLAPCTTWGLLDREKYSIPNIDFPNLGHRPLPGKSHSLPYKSCPFLPVQSFSSDEDEYSEPEDDDDDDSDKGIYEDMFCKSLPSARHFQELNWECSETVVLNSTEISTDSHTNNQSECQDCVECGQDSPSVNQSEDITWTDTEITPNNGMDIHIVDQCKNKVDLRSLPMESLMHLDVEETKIENISTENVKEENASKEAEQRQHNEEMESTDHKEEAQICSQEESHSVESEEEEDTYFGPDVISPEPSNTGPSYANLIEEEHTTENGQQADSEICQGIEASELTLVDEASIATPSASPDTMENDEAVEQILPLNNDMHGETDSSEVVDKQGGTTEVCGEGGEGVDELSAAVENIVKEEIAVDAKSGKTEEETPPVNEENQSKKDEEIVIDQECEIESEKEHETATSEQEDKRESEGVKENVEHETVKEIEMGGREEQAVFKKNEEDVEKLTLEKGKGGGEREEESDEQIEEYDLQEETQASQESHLQEGTEINEGSIPEEKMASEMNDGENRSLEDSVDSTEPGIILEEEQSKCEERIKEEANAESSKTSGEKPVRYPRMKEIERGKGAGLGPGVGRTLVVSRQSPTRLYQAKAVPVVPPKPQHSKITAFKQQFQQRDNDRPNLDRSLQHRDVMRHPQQSDAKDKDLELQSSDKEKDPREEEKGDLRQNHEQGNGTDGHKMEEDKAKMKDTSSGEMYLSLGWETKKGEDREQQGERRGTWDGGSWKKDGQKELDKETKRASGISICFDEAVARATGKRCKDKERCDQKDGSIQRKREDEGKID